MWPHLRPGDRVLVDPNAYRRRAPGVGEVVVADHPFRSDVRWVKRVVALTSTGALELVGDNPDESTDSRTQGAVPLHQVRGRVTSVLVRPLGDDVKETDRRG
jgi:nickel-type superoxide dismutase maturation protease